MPKGFEPAFALMRVFRDQIKPLDSTEALELFRLGTVSVLRIYWTPEEAASEAARLNTITVNPDAFYYVLHTRVKIRDNP